MPVLSRERKCPDELVARGGGFQSDRHRALSTDRAESRAIFLNEMSLANALR